MARITEERELSQHERSLVQICAENLWEHGELGYGQIARLCGLPWGNASEDHTRRVTTKKIYGLMPWISMRVTQLHPGHTIAVSPGEPLRVTSEASDVRAMVLARRHKAFTINQRLYHEAAPLRNSTDSFDRLRAATIDAIYNMQRVALEAESAMRPAIEAPVEP